MTETQSIAQSKAKSSPKEAVKEFIKAFWLAVKDPAVLLRQPARSPWLDLATVLVAGAVFLASTVLLGGSVYATLYYYKTTFLPEMLLGGQLFGFIIPPGNIAAVFIDGLLSCVKEWLLFSVIIYIFSRITRDDVNFHVVARVVSICIAPLAVYSAILLPASFVVMLFAPSVYNYVFLLGMIFLVLATGIRNFVVCTRAGKPGISIRKAMLLYLAAVFLLYLIFTINHYEHFGGVLI
nr:hypothetical protein [Candidatus Sigynarchaeota archaeon]